MNKIVLFYSSVKSKKQFSFQRFYRTDISILRDLGYKVKLSNSFFDYFAFWKYNIAFIYFYRFGILPAIIAKMFRKKVVFTGGIDYLERAYAGEKAYIIQKYFFILCSFFSDINILVSNADRNNINKFKSSIKSKKYPLSFHVIDFELYKYDFISQKEKLVVTIAWMGNDENVLRKGLDKSIQVFKELKTLDSDFRMKIIGAKGTGASMIEKLIESLELKNEIELTGAIPESLKINILKKSMVYIQLSLYEGFGIAAIEALASGNIVIHSNKGGLADGVGEHGVIIDDPNNFSQIAKIILEQINSPFKAEKLLKGINYVSLNFKYEKRLSDFKSIFINIE